MDWTNVEHSLLAEWGQDRKQDRGNSSSGSWHSSAGECEILRVLGSHDCEGGVGDRENSGLGRSRGWGLQFHLLFFIHSPPIPALLSMLDLSSLAGTECMPPAVEGRSLSHRTTREVPAILIRVFRKGLNLWSLTESEKKWVGHGTSWKNIPGRGNSQCGSSQSHQYNGRWARRVYEQDFRELGTRSCRILQEIVRLWLLLWWVSSAHMFSSHLLGNFLLPWTQ